MCEDDRVSIDHPSELAALRAVGRVVAETIRELTRRVRPGVSTAELDEVAADVFPRHSARPGGRPAEPDEVPAEFSPRHGARSGPMLDYDFPGTTCISVDDECVHG